ncbi:hypothetical protein [Planctomyces sp. SH-PL62]|uniref:hypothetical protein n=1 Tax=Planctomyces sp. SH-PL62 TaxID=1636152 RepID=UPI00078D59D0|nr:hypothetical protein [Planctomyces sp. SH-PL62]AMV40399.1 hypothetical protein VT85_23410 [Planctomyces sp. SH-PL62]
MMKDADALQGSTRTAQIIIAALVMGVVMFWAIITLVLPAGVGPQPAPGAAGPDILGLPILTALAVGFGAVSVVMSLALPRVMVDGALRGIAKGLSPDSTTDAPPGAKQIYPAGDVEKLLPVYISQLIVASALNEGAAFFAGIAYMMEHHAASILVAGVLLALMLTRFPTADRIQIWLEAQLQNLAGKRRDDF